ncbi:toll-like receptor 21 [Echeneis naucrates]|uniref:Toll-like receptor 13 n=1 Tax=Echeneis naucrates TaxID=173247 RepID=A0A665WEF4_ECHNA|nr:toll-like receptor 13 [Echeneis naucrates]XP_029359806.1 toll-like receptor 13 [Echeneis naucrates]
MNKLIVNVLAVNAALGAIQLISGYSYNNCIEDPYSNGTAFNCKNRKEVNMFAIVKDLPSSAINLTIFKTYAEYIPNYSFQNLTNLQLLKMDNNYLKTIDEFAFQNLHQLQTLNLSCNDISELKPSLFNDLHNLTNISLAYNKLKQLPGGIFASTLKLNIIIIRQNFLTNFSEIAKSVSHLKTLRKLDLSSNNFTSLIHSNVSLPKSLASLYISKNNLLTLGCKDSFLQYIKVLDLAYNSRLPTKAFQGVDFSHLNYLRLRSTNVSIVEFLNISNVSPGHVDFSGMRLKNGSLVSELCRLLKTKVKTLKRLSLNDNGIVNLTNYLLSSCPEITGELDLSRNRLKSTSCLNFLKGQTNIKSFNAEHCVLKSLPSCRHSKVYFKNLEELSYRYNRILSVSSFAFNNMPHIMTLKLNINTIAFLDRKALKGLKSLVTLRLDNNLLTDLFNDTFADNFRLQVLNLRNNHISVIFNGTFLRLGNLSILDLGGNKITHFEPSGLDGLQSLSKLYLDGNNLKQIDTSIYRVFQNTLTTLDLQSNLINFLTDNQQSPFMNLSKLSDLKLDGQRPHGMTVLPQHFFRGLYSLTSLYLTNNNIYRLPPNVFDDLTSLHFLALDRCCVGVTQLQPGVFKNLRSLTKLAVEDMGIQNFSKEVFGNLTKLRSLQLNRNVMQNIQVDALESLPKLHYLDIRNNPLSCTCQNSLLQNWTQNNPQVQVVYLYSVQCQDHSKFKFYNFDVKVCYIDLGEYMFFSTAVVIFLFSVTPLLHVKLYWKIKYSYYVFNAWFSDRWRRLSEEEENCKYDAFISYNSSDEKWVMEHLLPNLEGNGSFFKLCLHHRDFELGRDIVDNIVSAVYSSRKTICVVSRNFLQSEWCSLEIQLASYRLFDEHRDVLLLVFLETISDRQLSSYHRMRKVMLKKTYLQWPNSDCMNPGEAQKLFWNQLRRAMRKGSRLETEENESESFVTAKSEEYEDFKNSDERYLLP